MSRNRAMNVDWGQHNVEKVKRKSLNVVNLTGVRLAMWKKFICLQSLSCKCESWAEKTPHPTPSFLLFCEIPGSCCTCGITLVPIKNAWLRYLFIVHSHNNVFENIKVSTRYTCKAGLSSTSLSAPSNNSLKFCHWFRFLNCHLRKHTIKTSDRRQTGKNSDDP